MARCRIALAGACWAWGAVLAGAVLALAGSPELAPPVRLTADGAVIDTGNLWGHSSPCVEDLDGDGLKDLLVGDFSGKFRVYKNVGREGAPQFTAAGVLQAGGVDAKVHIYCCIGSQPRFADLDGDGLRDVISNSYDPGHCYLFRGQPGHKFASIEEVVDKAGVPVRSEPKQQQNFQSFGSFYAPVDWDADGDFDLLIGCFDGALKLRINEGDAKAFAFAAENQTVEAAGEPLKVSAHLCPVVADWDDDGQWDIVAGSDDGSVTWFRNVGKPGAPEFVAGVVLVEKHDGNGYNLLRWSDDDVRPGIRSQVEVTDFNDDGKLDLIVGDFCTAYAPKPDLTPAQREEMQAIIQEAEELGKPVAEKMEALRKEFAERYPGDAIYSDEATEAWSKAYQAQRESPEAKQAEASEAEFVRRMRPLLAETNGSGDRSFDLAASHGYVWLYLRK